MHKRFSTVRVQTTVGATAALAFALLLSGAIIVHAERVDLEHNIATNARLRATDLAGSFAGNTLSTPIAEQPGGDVVVAQVVDAGHHVFASSLNLQGLPPISEQHPEPGTFATEKIERLPAGKGKDFVVAAYGVHRNDGEYVVLVASSLEAVTDSTQTLIGLFAVIIPILVVVVSVTTWMVVGRALRPVDEMRREVRAIESTDLHRRLSEPATEDEIDQLAKTLNAMLDRLQHSSERQQRFVADASHELRSPLTAIRSRLEVDLAYPDGADWRSTEQDVLEEALRLQRLVEDLLTLARFDDSPQLHSMQQPIDLDEIVLQQARQLREQTVHGVDTSAVSGAQILGNSDQLARAIRNLLDNANRHAISSITLTLHETDSVAVLTIADDGSGIPAASKDVIFERFLRLDDARARDTGGSGLGLAIAKEIVDIHNGTISVTNDPGAKFTLIFPTH